MSHVGCVSLMCLWWSGYKCQLHMPPPYIVLIQKTGIRIRLKMLKLFKFLNNTKHKAVINTSWHLLLGNLNSFSKLLSFPHINLFLLKVVIKSVYFQVFTQSSASSLLQHSTTTHSCRLLCACAVASILIHAASSAECKDEVCAVKKIWNERRKIVKTSERNGLPWTQTGTKRYNFKAVISKWTLWLLIFYKLLNRCTLQVKRTGLFWTNKRPWERISVRFSMSPADPRMIARYVDGLNMWRWPYLWCRREARRPPARGWDTWRPWPGFSSRRRRGHWRTRGETWGGTFDVVN